MPQSLTVLLRRLWEHIEFRRKRQFLLLIVLTAVSALSEAVSVAAILPFIKIITDPDQVFLSPFFSQFNHFLGIKSSSDLVVPLTFLFIALALLAGILRLLLIYVGTRIANGIGADLGVNIFSKTLYQPYAVHISRSSSEIISGITQKVGAATGVLIASVNCITSSLLFVAVIFTLLGIDFRMAVVAFASFGLLYVLIATGVRARLEKNSVIISASQTQVTKALQEGLGSIRDVLLDGAQKVYCKIYEFSIIRLQRASGENSFITQAPRYLMETFGIALICIFIILTNDQPGGVVASLPLFVMLAFGAQRLLPIMQQLFGNWSVLSGSKASLTEVLELLDQPIPSYLNHAQGPTSICFSRAIDFQNVSFKYGSQLAYVLKDINLTINKGARIGIIGSTGSGKSTSMDLLMGLLEPSNGAIVVDGKVLNSDNRHEWQKMVAHVPQNIFLTDGSIAENIAFGVPLDQIDPVRVRRAAEQAMIDGFIEGRENGYDSLVGERGVRLSGGQRQRIAIARALYKKSSLLIFDEATSALDSETEATVMQSIEDLSKDLTLVVVAHRITTLKGCDLIIRLEHGRVYAQGSYDQIIGEG